MEYMKKRGRPDLESYRKFKKSWIKAECPKHFRLDQDGNRIWDIPAMREKLQMREETHEDKMARLQKAENELRFRRLHR